MRAYNLPVSTSASSRSALARLAVWLSFVALFSALLTPVLSLAQDVRTGKLGGLCSVKNLPGAAGQFDSDDGESGQHCDACLTPGLVLLHGLAAVPGSPERTALLLANVPSTRSVVVLGLPFGRGPPALT